MVVVVIVVVRHSSPGYGWRVYVLCHRPHHSHLAPRLSHCLTSLYNSYLRLHSQVTQHSLYLLYLLVMLHTAMTTVHM